MHTGRGVGPGVHSEPPFWEREVIGGGISDSTIRKSDGVSYRLTIVTTALFLTIWPNLRSNVSDAQINREWITLEQILGRNGLTDVSQILERSGRDMVLSYAKKSCGYLLPFDHNARTWQTDKRETDRSRNTGTVIPISEIAVSDVA